LEQVKDAPRRPCLRHVCLRIEDRKRGGTSWHTGILQELHRRGIQIVCGRLRIRQSRGVEPGEALRVGEQDAQLSSPKIIESADQVVRRIIETYGGPNKTFRDVSEVIDNDA
jgi:hypothetical protein